MSIFRKTILVFIILIMDKFQPNFWQVVGHPSIFIVGPIPSHKNHYCRRINLCTYLFNVNSVGIEWIYVFFFFQTSDFNSTQWKLWKDHHIVVFFLCRFFIHLWDWASILYTFCILVCQSSYNRQKYKNMEMHFSWSLLFTILSYMSIYSVNILYVGHATTAEL